MARRTGGLGRGLDALIPKREEIEKAMQISDAADVEVLFSDEEEDDIEHTFDKKKKPASEPRKKAAKQPAKKSAVEQQEEPAGQTVEELAEQPAEEPAGEPIEQPTEESQAEEPAADGNVVIVRISEIEPNRSQPRKTFDEDKLEELAGSIAEYGVLQPLLVQRKDDHYEIIAGERRWRAALKAGVNEVPVIVRDYDEKEVLALSLIENIQRENLNAIEEAAAYQRLIDEFGLRQEEVAQRVSKSRSAITNALRLLRLDGRVQEMVVDGSISMGHARALLPLEDSEKQYALAQRIVREKMSVRDTEKEVKRILRSAAGAGKDKDSAQDEEDASVQLIYDEIEERLRQMLHTKVVIRRSRKGSGKLSIDFYDHDDLERIIEMLSRDA